MQRQKDIAYREAKQDETRDKTSLLHLAVPSSLIYLLSSKTSHTCIATFTTFTTNGSGRDAKGRSRHFSLAVLHVCLIRVSRSSILNSSTLQLFKGVTRDFRELSSFWRVGESR